jgi:DNA-binding NtrC family response regulator
MRKVLVIDEDDDLRAIIGSVLRDEGFLVSEASSGVNAIPCFHRDMPDAVLLDLKMPQMSGIETMRHLKRINSQVPVIILIAFCNIQAAVEVMRAGAHDIAVKPPDFAQLVASLKKAVGQHRAIKAMASGQPSHNGVLDFIIGKSDRMRQVMQQISQIAKTDLSIILEGETGTGKSLIAKAIHQLSARAAGPFVVVDIGLIPDTLVESELFGYRRGAFTGAERNKPGYFEASQDGTILIDELENVSSHVQGKLLSVIERRKVHPLGCSDPIDLNVRVIAATNSDIRQCVIGKNFREDLFYRLGETIIALPPLRDRIEDLPLLAEVFLVEACAEFNKRVEAISESAMHLLMQHSWPGNIRQLRNVIRKGVLSAPDEYLAEENVELLINADVGRGMSTTSLKESLKTFENKRIVDALRLSSGNRTKAAALLKTSYRNIMNKIKEYQIPLTH